MRRFKIYCTMSVILLVVCGAVLWWSTPVHIENMNRMSYCACGYAKVQFKDGKITMVEYFHDTPKPGDVIGRYTVTNRDVKLEIYFHGKTNVIQCRIDNIGLRAPLGSWLEYIAFDGKSLKPYIYHIARKIF